MSDNVEHPSHYNAGSVETIDAIKSALGDAFLDYCRGNVIKYVWRCRHKGKLLEDLRKAAKYLEWAIEEAESEKTKRPQPLAIPDGWRELEENEPLSEDDLFELDGEWVGHECDPSGGVYSSRIYCRHIRKIETHEPEPLAIPDGWRELEFGETRLKTDLYSYDGKWVPYTDFDPVGSEFPKYDKRIHHQHIRKIETANPSEVPSISIPDPGPGYRLLSKDPPEPVVEGDEYLAFDGEWSESENWRHRSSPQSERFYYRRKIEPAQWIPKVGDRVRVAKECEVWRYGTIRDIHPKGELFLFQSDDGRYQGWLLADRLELIEAAQ